MKVLGIDASLVSCGVATITEPVNLDSGAFGLKGHDDEPVTVTDDRIKAVTNFVAAHFTDVDLAVIEGPAYGAIGGRAHERAGLWWRIIRRLRIADIPIAVANPGSLKKWATGYGAGPKGSKGAVRQGVAKFWPQFDGLVDDEYDALGLASMAAQQLGFVAVTAKHQASALVAVKWPDGIRETSPERESNNINTPPLARHARGHGSGARARDRAAGIDMSTQLASATQQPMLEYPASGGSHDRN